MGRHDESRRIGEDVCKTAKRAMELFLQDILGIQSSDSIDTNS
jgi:hypothetical protein